MRDMQIDTGDYADTVDGGARSAVQAERDGFDGWVAIETKADPFLSAVVAAERTNQIELVTGIAVAFARNPMTVALQANDVHALSGGRFVLGLGSQIKPHITRRYSMPWSKPAARMREFVLAIRAIWHAWETGEPLAFRGEFYTHTLMTPFFNPGPNPHGNPPVILAGVGPLMTQAAGEVADGLVCHGFSTPRYVHEVTIPALLAGRRKAGADGLDGFSITAPSMAAMGDTDAELESAIAAVRQQLGFYGSTPAYRGVLELHGWGDLQPQLADMSREGEWDKMAGLITDEMVDAFAVVGTPEAAVHELRRRYGDVAQRVNMRRPPNIDDERWRALAAALRGS
jgi:probable F420-dependent oxidoreductase